MKSKHVAQATPSESIRARRVHLVGAGGSGMSGLAMMLHAEGVSVTGSDMADSPTLAPLATIGIPIAIGPSAGGLPEDRDLLVYSAAIPHDHPELLEAQHRGMEILSYAEALGRAQAERTGISIAGTHGKSTTTALLSHIRWLRRMGRPSTVQTSQPQLAT